MVIGARTLIAMSLSGNNLVEICVFYWPLGSVESSCDEESPITLHRTPLLVMWGGIRFIGFLLISAFAYVGVASSI